ncbi:MAG: hypothetical protein ISS28_00600 [Candidatus Cloacimonetes bacterium]|nr:hypothetical protein [Bacteroidota bacterium]MBL7085587.1 hypothetical protein [Candidatus Cloacimonadota bacterium]
MNNIRIRKIIIVIAALSGTIINAIYGIGLLRVFFNPQYNNTIREILISAIVLEFGWFALLVWVVFKPFERRNILLFTIIPIFFGNILTGINQLMNTSVNMGHFVKNTLFGFLYSGLFFLAYILGKPAENSQI